MIKFYILLIAIISFLTSGVFGQSAASGPASSSTSLVERKAGKVVLPPEKANPVTIPKIGTPIVIDGRPDEEAWQSPRYSKTFTRPARR